MSLTSEQLKEELRRRQEQRSALAKITPNVISKMNSVELDDWQLRVVTSNRNVILNCSRQVGKSLTTAITAVYCILTNPGATVIVLAPTQNQSKLLLRTIKRFWLPFKAAFPEDLESEMHLRLKNDSVIYALPGKESSVRGISAPKLIIIDEASKVDDSLYYSIRPMLAVSTEGKIVALSTPWGKRGWFYQEWSSTDNKDFWEKIKITAYDCKRIPREFLIQERKSLPPPIFASEYMGEFGDTTSSVFASEIVVNALSEEVSPLFSGGTFTISTDDSVSPIFDSTNEGLTGVAV